MPNAPRLPPELLDEVFTTLHPPFDEDSGRWKADLRAVSLVSQEWHEAALPHLFRVVPFQFWNCDIPGARDHSKLAHGMTSLKALAEFLDSAPAIRASVRGLDLKRAPSGDESTVLMKFLQSPTIDCSSLYQILRGLPQLLRLRMSGIALATPSSPLPPLPSIKLLEVCGTGNPMIWRPSVENILRIPQIYREIDTLCFTDFYFTEPTTPCATVTPAVCVTSFIDKAVGLNAFYQVLEAVDTTHLHSMHLPTGFFLSTVGQAAKATMMLDHLGSQLTQIGFAFTENAYRRDCEQVFSRCPNLQTVTLSIAFPSPSQHLTLAFALSKCETRWAQLARCIPTFPSRLKTLVFEIDVDEGLSYDGLAGVRRQMPTLEKALRDQFGGVVPRILVHPRDKGLFTMPERALLVPLFPPGSVRFQRPA